MNPSTQGDQVESLWRRGFRRLGWVRRFGGGGGAVSRVGGEEGASSRGVLGYSGAGHVRRKGVLAQRTCGVGFHLSAVLRSLSGDAPGCRTLFQTWPFGSGTEASGFRTLMES